MDDRRTMRRWLTGLGLLLAVAAGGLVPAQAGTTSFGDVPTSYWDYTAIQYVGQTNTWMQDYGTSTFKPTDPESRKLLARALVQAFAPNEPINPAITFKDLPATDPFYPYANVATKLGWLPKFSSGNWFPDGTPYTSTFDRALILAMGQFSSEIAGLLKISDAGGYVYPVFGLFPYIQLAHFLGLHYNHGDETLDLNKLTPVRRDEVAYSLWKAKTIPSSTISGAQVFDSVVLPNLNVTDKAQAAKRALTTYALNQAGFPYIWGGEWNTVTPTGYCCGSQPQGGMDCSGFVWWVMKQNEGGYDAAQFHPDYAGWTLPQRTSSTMAQYTTTPLATNALRIGDLMFFSSSGGSTYQSVDHVGMYLGNGWMIHSGGSADGVVLQPVATGWYADHFVYGRRMIPVGTAPPARTATAPGRFDPTGGDGPREGGEAHP